jgi:UDP-glucose 4-epimerase
MIKYICEKRLEQFWNKTGIPVCILRLTNVYGMNDYQSHLIPEIFQQILSGQTIINVGNLFSRRDYVYVKDVAKIIGKKIYDNFKFEITNVATGSCYSVIDILDIISSVKKIKYEGSSINSKIRKVDSTLVALSNNKLMQFYCKPLTELHEGLKHLCTDLKL